LKQGPAGSKTNDNQGQDPTGSKDGDGINTPLDFERVTPDNLKPKDLLGCKILLDHDDGSKLRAKILKAIENPTMMTSKTPKTTKLLIAMGKDKRKELMWHQQVLDHINKDMEGSRKWKFRPILGHQGPLTKDDPDYIGSSYNVKIKWENGEITPHGPPSVIAINDPSTFAPSTRKGTIYLIPLGGRGLVD
jgi:hypothetical protein